MPVCWTWCLITAPISMYSPQFQINFLLCQVSSQLFLIHILQVLDDQYSIGLFLWLSVSSRFWLLSYSCHPSCLECLWGIWVEHDEKCINSVRQMLQLSHYRVCSKEEVTDVVGNEGLLPRESWQVWSARYFTIYSKASHVPPSQFSLVPSFLQVC